MPRNKKTGVTGRFGPRYGSTVRKRVLDVEVLQKTWHTCPRCKSKKTKRTSIGIWVCRFCDYKFAGGAFVPSTSTGLTSISTAKRLSTK